MFYITGKGRIVNDTSLIEDEEYLVRETYPEVPHMSGKVGIVSGIDFMKDEIIYTYLDEIVQEPEPISDNELIQAEMLLNQCSIMINQENQDAVLAEILINQLGV